ncbi:hypothetical protein BY996DRAFT_8515816 [Phakopsora pachyrhizi]|nr:hypothetical protein BY996DRAFT_8515816 [Phakopsora pachyrhizi]
MFDISSIQTIEQLNEKEEKVIEFFKAHDRAATSESKINQARNLIEQFRRETLLQLPSCKLGDAEASYTFQAGHQPFDRLLYLLDRYTEYSNSIGLSAWPVHYLKVAIWIKGDVISLRSRIVPLRKTVRCYITTMETIRVKTQRFFPKFYERQQKPLLTSGVLKELLNTLPITRSSSITGTGWEGDVKEIGAGAADYESTLIEIRKISGDSKAEEAFSIVKASRSQTSNPNGLKFAKKKPDPHIHTLNRYHHFCTSNRIPTWPIEPLRVSIWLKDSVLSVTSSEYSRFKVSLRTVQVYLSRLEYARLRTEILFKDEFGEVATSSLYRSQAINDVLESFASTEPKIFSNRESSLTTEEDQMDGEFSDIESRKRKHFSDQSSQKTSPNMYTARSISNVFASRLGVSQSRNTFRRDDEEETYRQSSPSEDSDDSRYSPRPRSTSSESVSSSDDSRSSAYSSSLSQKGRLSYILCSDYEVPDYNRSYQDFGGKYSSEKHQEIGKSAFSLAPLKTPRLIVRPRFVIPSIENFVFSLHDK